MARSALLLLVAACGSPPPAAPIQGSAAGAAPTGAPPAIAWKTGAFDRTGLPAVSNDAQLVVFPTFVNDGGRGNVNLALESRTRGDIGDQKIKVLTIDETERLVTDDQQPTPELAKRISAANTWLADLHRRVDLRPLAAMQVDTTDRWTQHAATLAGATLDWQNDRLIITKGTTTLLARDTPVTWHAPDRDQCSNPAKLGEVWIDVERKIALVAVAYNGNDACWEPSDQLHVVSW